MKCPKCKKELDAVLVKSECYQKAKTDNAKIIDYGTPEVADTISIHCLYCNQDVSNIIKEK